MGKYEPLTRHLKNLPVDCWDADFATIEGVLGFDLCDSANTYYAWWANQAGANHSQARGWRDAGWRTSKVNLEMRTVRFEREGVLAEPAQSRSTATVKPDLWTRAEQITGITDRDTLIETALNVLIRRSLAAQIAAFGSSDPDAVAAPRERPFA